MIKYTKLHDVVIQGNNTLPVIVQSEDGKAMAHVPGWKSYFDPEFMQVDPAYVLNRASGRSSTVTVTLNPTIEIDPDNGQKFVRSQAGQSNGFSWVDSDSGELSPQSWSFWAVIKGDFSSNVPAARSLINDLDESKSGIGLSIAHTGANRAIQVYEYFNSGAIGAPIRLTYTPTDTEALMLVMVTFSTRDGLRIFRDGVLVASAPSDKRPFTRAVKAISQGRFYRGWYGRSGLLNIDLGWTEHTAYRQAIEQFLIQKYGIAA
nr:hypothetical protein [Alcaligenes faecalis]